jgi:membrane dipeptidase
MPVGLEDVTGFPKLTAGLLARGYDEADVKKILGENSLRALAEAEARATADGLVMSRPEP